MGALLIFSQIDPVCPALEADQDSSIPVPAVFLRGDGLLSSTCRLRQPQDGQVRVRGQDRQVDPQRHLRLIAGPLFFLQGPVDPGTFCHRGLVGPPARQLQRSAPQHKFDQTPHRYFKDHLFISHLFISHFYSIPHHRKKASTCRSLFKKHDHESFRHMAHSLREPDIWKGCGKKHTPFEGEWTVRAKILFVSLYTSY